MLKIRNLVVAYDQLQALKDVSLEVKEGQIVTLVGANGAGKSTLLNAISKIVPIQSGSIEFLQERIDSLPPHKVVQRGIIQSPEGRKVVPHFSVLDNLLLGSYNRRDKAKIQDDLEEVFSYFPRLKERIKQPAGTLSGGEQQMVAIGRALMANPRLLLLDEPSLGLAPLIVEEIFHIIRSINQLGKTVVLVEQNARAALRLAHYAYILETGKISFHGTGEEMLGDPRVQAAYLGGGH
ncbi:ABC transporter ATP-binding protein [Brevibacillus sp. H7]|jgi:branched-chain amino acid transport system ATP-binding protein|uniref:ABC transporter ATP-binding protein n=1 Tax=Brevibacillus sp. H7 TaxID=3349138 RepID=UPI00382DF1A6